MNANQALELVLDGTTTELDSGDGTDIDGDASFPLPVDEESEQSEYDGKIYTFCQVIITYSKATQILLSCVETPASEESRVEQRVMK